jgi:hypothetical protein
MEASLRAISFPTLQDPLSLCSSHTALSLPGDNTFQPQGLCTYCSLLLACLSCSHGCLLLLNPAFVYTSQPSLLRHACHFFLSSAAIQNSEKTGYLSTELQFNSFFLDTNPEECRPPTLKSVVSVPPTPCLGPRGHFRESLPEWMEIKSVATTASSFFFFFWCWGLSPGPHAC